MDWYLQVMPHRDESHASMAIVKRNRWESNEKLDLFAYRKLYDSLGKLDVLSKGRVERPFCM